MRTKAMRRSGKLQLAKNRKHYCRPALKSCDFHFGVGHLLEQRLGHCCAWAEGQRCTVPKSHVHACFELLEFGKVCVKKSSRRPWRSLRQKKFAEALEVAEALAEHVDAKGVPSVTKVCQTCWKVWAKGQNSTLWVAFFW